MTFPGRRWGRRRPIAGDGNTTSAGWVHPSAFTSAYVSIGRHAIVVRFVVSRPSSTSSRAPLRVGAFGVSTLPWVGSTPSPRKPSDQPAATVMARPSGRPLGQL